MLRPLLGEDVTGTLQSRVFIGYASFQIDIGFEHLCLGAIEFFLPEQ